MREKIVISVIKRNGESVEFDKVKIKSAISNAFIEIDGKLDDKSNEIIDRIADSIEGLNKDLNVEEIQDIIENKLMSSWRMFQCRLDSQSFEPNPQKEVRK